MLSAKNVLIIVPLAPIIQEFALHVKVILNTIDSNCHYKNVLAY